MEQRIFSPRIRGRQAFADLLMQMEKERHGELNVLIERKAVSRFAQKGRIQSMLRLRLLQRGTPIQDPQRPRFAAASHQVERLPQGSTIMHLRERFTIGAEHGTTSQSDATTDPRNPRRETINDTGNYEKSSVPNKPDVQIQNQEGNFIEQQDRTTLVHDPPAHNIEEIHNEPVPLTPVQETRTVVQDPPVHNTKDVHGKSNPLTPVQDTITLIQDPPEHNTEDIHEEPGLLTPIQDKITSVQDPQAHIIEDTHVKPGPSSSITWQETSSDYRNLDAQETESEDRNLASQETADATTFCGGWDGNDVADLLEDNYQAYAETSYDWISDISRPRSYWEDRRQEWYHEMLNSNSENAEIRRLLERGTVSSFLASDFRERMDRLMETRLEIRQAQPAGGSQGAEDDEGHSKLMSFIQNHRQRKQQQEHKMEEEEIGREEQERGEVKVEEDETFISGQYHEASDYFDQPTLSPLQVPSQSLLRSWSFQDNEVGDESDRAPSTSPCQDFWSHSYYPNAWRCTSSTNHPSIEMELICEAKRANGAASSRDVRATKISKELHGHADDINAKFHEAGMEGRENKSSGRAVPKKGNCCICYEMKVDSLLYRCGHMCVGKIGSVIRVTAQRKF
ncbi:hypothetical protein TIFTF001_050475 [Ficus carica]|uniref:Uncharacterized protein n=1 Tax=Ficus carica TaxID=3494 RepID=A0AA87Z7X0_FICCA|nr:hypothetical protein TIFTF001_050475 [Ficus carica]